MLYLCFEVVLCWEQSGNGEGQRDESRLMTSAISLLIALPMVIIEHPSLKMLSPMFCICGTRQTQTQEFLDSKLIGEALQGMLAEEGFTCTQGDL
jgi:hypothetical protein